MYWIEWQNITWTPENINIAGIVVCVILGSYGLFHQAWKIWREPLSGEKADRTKSVSTVWTLIFLFMFIAYIIWGNMEGSHTLLFQGVVRVIFYIPVLLGILVFRGFLRKEKLLLLLFILATLFMVLRPLWAHHVLIAFAVLGTAGVFTQGWNIWQNKTAGNVSLPLLVIYATNVCFWVWYGYQFYNNPGMPVLFWTTLTCVPAYFFTLTMWYRYRPAA